MALPAMFAVPFFLLVSQCVTCRISPASSHPIASSAPALKKREHISLSDILATLLTGHLSAVVITMMPAGFQTMQDALLLCESEVCSCTQRKASGARLRKELDGMQGQHAIQSGDRTIIATSSSLDSAELTAGGRSSSWLVARPELKELRQCMLGYCQRAAVDEDMQDTRARCCKHTIASSSAEWHFSHVT